MGQPGGGGVDLRGGAEAASITKIIETTMMATTSATTSQVSGLSSENLRTSGAGRAPRRRRSFHGLPRGVVPPGQPAKAS